MPVWKGEQFSQVFTEFYEKFKSGHQHYVPKLYTWYYDPSSSRSPGILLTMLLHYTKCQSWKREIIQSNIDRIFPKVNQVIYTLDTSCMPNIMTPAQAVLQIFCSQGLLWVKCLSPKRGIIQSNFYRVLWKVNQVISIMYPNCMPDIMILAQVVLQIFCSQGCFTTQNDKSQTQNDTVGQGR